MKKILLSVATLLLAWDARAQEAPLSPPPPTEEAGTPVAPAAAGIEAEIDEYTIETGTTLKDGVRLVVEGPRTTLGAPIPLVAAATPAVPAMPATEYVEIAALEEAPVAEAKTETEVETVAAIAAPEGAVNPMAEKAGETAAEKAVEKAPAATEAKPSDKPAAAAKPAPAPEGSRFVSVELDGAVKPLKAKLGQIVEISLRSVGAREWTFDKNTKFLKVLDNKRDGETTKVSLEVTGQGFDRIYFDLVDKSKGAAEVIESRILDVTSEI